MKRLMGLILVVCGWLALAHAGQAQSNQGSVNVDVRASADQGSACTVSGVERVCRLAPDSRQMLVRIFHNGLPSDTRLGARLVSLGGLTVYSGDVKSVGGDGVIDYTVTGAQVFTSLVTQAQDNVNRARDAVREAEAAQNSPSQARSKMGLAIDAATQAKNALGMLARYGLDANLLAGIREMRDQMTIVTTKGSTVLYGASGAALTDAIRDAKTAAEAASGKMGSVRPNLDAQSSAQPFPQSPNQERSFTVVLERDGEIAQTLEMSISAAEQAGVTSTPTVTLAPTTVAQPSATTAPGPNFQASATPPPSVTPNPTAVAPTVVAPTPTTESAQPTAPLPNSPVIGQPAAPIAQPGAPPGAQPTLSRGPAQPGQPANPGGPGPATNPGSGAAPGAAGSTAGAGQPAAQGGTPVRPVAQPPIAGAPITITPGPPGSVPSGAAPNAPAPPTATPAPKTEVRPTATPLRVVYGRVDLSRLTPMPNGDLAVRVDSAAASRVAGARAAAPPWLMVSYVLALSALGVAAVWMRRHL